MNYFTFIIVLLSILAAVPAYADGGGPILLLLSAFMFVVGQVWIVFSEFVYLKLLLKSEASLSVLKVVVKMNLISMVLGGLALPIFFALVGLVGGLMMGNPNFNWLGEYFFAAGTWVAGDNSPHANLALISTGVGFVGTYFITVYVERRYLESMARKNLFPHISLPHCYGINATSYMGLISLMYLAQ